MKKEFKVIMIGTREIAKTQISDSLNEHLDTKTAPKQSSVSQKLSKRIAILIDFYS